MADQVTVTLTVDRADAETALWVQQDGKSRLAVPADQLRAALDFPGEDQERPYPMTEEDARTCAEANGVGLEIIEETGEEANRG